jgi:hypothetical protein
MGASVPNPPNGGRAVAGVSGLVRTVGGTGAAWVGAKQGSFYARIFSRTAKHHKRNLGQTLKITNQIFFERNISKLNPIPPSVVADVSGFDSQRVKAYGRSLTAQTSIETATDVFQELALDTNALPVASITLKLTQILTKFNLINVFEAISNLDNLLVSSCTTFVFFAVGPFGPVNSRVINLIFLTLLFVSGAVGFFDSDKQYCEQYLEFFIKNPGQQTKKNDILFTINFLQKGKGSLDSLYRGSIIFKKSDFDEVLPRESYLEKNFFLNQCFLEDIFEFDI